MRAPAGELLWREHDGRVAQSDMRQFVRKHMLAMRCGEVVRIYDVFGRGIAYPIQTF